MERFPEKIFLLIMSRFENILITGGSGFIGTNLVINLLKNTESNIFNLDKLTYSGNKKNLDNFLKTASENIVEKYKFFHFDLTDRNNVKLAIEISNPDIIIHLAAESHVDRSISSHEIFLESNIFGTYNLLQESLCHYRKLNLNRKDLFRFYHISTDEVFGSLKNNDLSFNEFSNYDPRSPYAASKAASDHFVNAWHNTYGLPILISNCSNNYGPWQYPEKLIPLTISKALSGDQIPIYGDGKNIRDWLHVDDHINAINLIMNNGLIGKKYCIGGSNEISNIYVVNLICKYLDELSPNSNSYNEQISFVKDRPGHDFRYSIDSSYLKKSLGWKEKVNFKIGLKNTVEWYLKNKDWWKSI